MPDNVSDATDPTDETDKGGIAGRAHGAPTGIRRPKDRSRAGPHTTGEEAGALYEGARGGARKLDIPGDGRELRV